MRSTNSNKDKFSLLFSDKYIPSKENLLEEATYSFLTDVTVSLTL
jgi:hypothetical protein